MATVTVVVQLGVTEWQLVSETVANPAVSARPESPLDPGTETTRSAVHSQSSVPSGTETIAQRRDGQKKDDRHYCLWSAPRIGGRGPGVYSGSYPAVWSAILAEGKDGSSKLAGSGLVVQRFPSFEEALEGWMDKCPRKYANILAADPSVFKY